MMKRFCSTLTNQPLKRFWKEVLINETPQGYSIMLDNKPLKTTAGASVTIPKTKPVLALMTACEWERQKVLKAHALPLTGIVMRSFDIKPLRKDVIEHLMTYLHTDSVCYLQDYPSSFYELQKEYWLEIISKLNTKYGLEIKTTLGLDLKQDSKVYDFFFETISGFDDLKLAAFEQAVLGSKSLMISLALVERYLLFMFTSNLVIL
jgi:ATP synthase F1 complex assembly factor 2